MNEQTATMGGVLAFKDRETELDEVIGNVAEQSENRLMLLIAMPTMGKSRFLEHLPKEMRRRGLEQHQVYVDLGAEDPALRSRPGDLLERIFPGVDGGADPGEFPKLVATAIGKSKKPWLILLDNADLLTHHTAGEVRRVLCGAVQVLKEGGKGDRLAFVAASRVPIPAFRGLVPAPSFSTLVLSQFGKDVIANTLGIAGSEVGLSRDPSFYQELGGWVRSDTEGLPALLARTIEWIKDNKFTVADAPAEERSRQLFQSVVRPYVKDTLLAPNTLLPETLRRSSARAPERAMTEAFAELVLRLSVFRLVTRSHLNAMAARHPRLRQALQTISAVGDPYDLFGELSIVEPSQELWYSQYRAVRRLYFRYEYAAIDGQAGAHREAQDLYDQWPHAMSGDDSARFFIERLWHEVETVRLSGPENARARIEPYAEELLGQMQEREVRRAFGRLVREDDELKHSLEAIGLSPAVLLSLV